MRSRSKFRWGMAGGVALGATALFSSTAHADVTLVESDDWTVFVNGRMQTFLNYNSGDGLPPLPLDGYGQDVRLEGGGAHGNFEIIKEGDEPGVDQLKIEELRVRTGFVGNVLGFGIKNQLTPDTAVKGYTAVAAYISSTSRRKYLPVEPDWRESYATIEAPWGSVTFGRQLLLFSRGATEITFLYGYKYGLGWPGSIASRTSPTFPGAGSVGFGVLGSGFGAGIAYATPDLSGFQATVGVYDANNLPGSGTIERVKWPRGETELTYTMDLGDTGMFKLFGNGAWQKVYENEGQVPGIDAEQTIYGAGFGGRVEVGPVHLGLAAHYGQGIGVSFALEPNAALWHPDLPEKPFRPVDGAYAQLMVSLGEAVDVHAGAGITRVHRIDEDRVDQVDDDGDDPDRDGFADTDGDGVGDTPATDPSNDDAPAPDNDGDGVPDNLFLGPGFPDAPGQVPVKHQLGIGLGLTYHLSNSLHLNFEYFRAMFKWHTPLPAPVDGSEGPEQNFNVVNAGITYDF